MFNLSNIIYLVIAVVLSMSIHETAHGLVSYWMGDPTAKMEGRLSLNPFKHVDWIGLVCLLVCGFGWAGDLMLELVADVEIILQRAFAAPCDEGHIFHAGL